MRLLQLAAFCVLSNTASLPAFAEQSQEYFTQAVQICVDFGNDGFFVTDRLEVLGWVSSHSDAYGTDIMSSPEKSVLVVPPPEGADMPATCTVISDKLSLIEASESVQKVVSSSNVDYQLLSNQGCSEFDFFGPMKIQVWSGSKAGACSDPNNPRVDIITLVDPVADQ
ncbi:hypothetical protein [uncultured Cohaesibacter sp.]|uniref:hypothetical protein n=1 Tax=uncultured Cohaesibacter sp. TaxID=1002546 RepID=UPI0029316A8F|nr:hypothetical protein [uncultured Cohaesibacter sp.]